MIPSLMLEMVKHMQKVILIPKNLLLPHLVSAANFFYSGNRRVKET